MTTMRSRPGLSELGDRGSGAGRSWLAAGVVALGLAAASAAQPGSLIERSSPRDWDLRITVEVRPVTTWTATNPRSISPSKKPAKTPPMPSKEEFTFQTAAIVFPFIAQSASHRSDPSKFTGRVFVQDRLATDQTEIIATPYPAGTQLAKWGLIDWKGDDVRLEVKLQATCYKTKFREEEADKVGWPKGSWPPAAQSSFQPQLYIDRGSDGDYDMKPVKALVAEWCDGKDPKSIPPLKLAKWLTSCVLDHVQITGQGWNFARTGQLEGASLRSPSEAAVSGRVNELEVVNFLVAVFRTAGLPARVVIGYDITAEQGQDATRFLGAKGQAKVHAWAEFCLYDEAAPEGQRENWVPVDLIKLRRMSSRMPALEVPWRFFGSNDESDTVIPFAFHWFPPTTVRGYGSPGFWGWMVTPKPPDQAMQAITFLAMASARTAEDMPKPDEPQAPGYR